MGSLSGLAAQFPNEALAPFADRAHLLLVNNEVHKAFSPTHSPGSSAFWKTLFLDGPGGSG
jgi:hypothetical protein